MAGDAQDASWADLPCILGVAELAHLTALSPDDLLELVDYGLLTPVTGRGAEAMFAASCVEPLRRAGVLRQRYDLDLFVLGLMASQYEQIGRLEQQVRALQGHAPRTEPVREGPTPWHEPHG